MCVSPVGIQFGHELRSDTSLQWEYGGELQFDTSLWLESGGGLQSNTRSLAANSNLTPASTGSLMATSRRPAAWGMENSDAQFNLGALGQVDPCRVWEAGWHDVGRRTAEVYGWGAGVLGRMG